MMYKQLLVGAVFVSAGSALADAGCAGTAPGWCKNFVGSPPEPFANCSGSSDLAPAQCTAWQALYDALNGTNWNMGAKHRNDPCSIHSQHLSSQTSRTRRQGGGQHQAIVYCKDSVIESIDLRENRMIGQIPAEIGDLTGLLYLNLGVNHLYGTLPETMSKLVNLKELNFDGDKAPNGKFGLSGPIPQWIGELPNLSVVQLQINKFTGTIPSNINKNNLYVLYLYDNQLRGEVPPLDFTHIKWCGIGSSHNGLGKNVFCTPLPKGALGCKEEGPLDTSGPCN